MPNSPSLTAAVNASHSAGVNISLGPCGSFESRTAMTIPDPSRAARDGRDFHAAAVLRAVAAPTPGDVGEVHRVGLDVGRILQVDATPAVLKPMAARVFREARDPQMRD
jgi:hypothetical protein